MVTADTTIKGLRDNQHFVLTLFLCGEYIPVKRRLMDLIFGPNICHRSTVQVANFRILYNCLHVTEKLLEVPERYAS